MARAGLALCLAFLAHFSAASDFEEKVGFEIESVRKAERRFGSGKDASAPSAFCAFNTVPPRWTVASPECSLLESHVEPFERLLAAAGIRPGELVLSRRVFDESYYGKYRAYESPPEIRLSVAFVECLAGHRRGATWHLGHEVGHAVQDRMGIFRAVEEAFDKEPDREKAELLSRRLEAHASIVAHELLERAGYEETAAELIVSVQSCKDNPSRRGKFWGATTPSWASDWLMGVRARERRAQTLAGLRSGTYVAPPLPDESEVNREGGLLEPARHLDRDIPEPFRVMPSDGRVPLPNGAIWVVPAQIRYLTPAEIVAFVVKGDSTPDSIAQAFRAGIAELERVGNWDSLPGKMESGRR